MNLEGLIQSILLGSTVDSFVSSVVWESEQAAGGLGVMVWETGIWT